MQFIHDDFKLKIKLQNTWNSIWENYIKNIEFIFCDEKNFSKELKKIWWNINKNKEGIEIWAKTTEIKLKEWFSEYEKSNIFYDYNNIIFEINNEYKIKLIDENIDWKWFLEEIIDEENENKKYKLWYTLQNNNSDEVFGFWGFVRFQIYKNNKKYIFAPFFKTKNLKEDEEVKDMVEEIKKEMLNSLLSYKSISNFWYKIKNNRNNNQQLWEFINIFNEIYKDLERSINDIYENPKYINKTIHQYKKYNSWKVIIDNRLINHSINKWFIKDWKLDIFWRIIPQRTVEWDYNNIPNKVFIDLLQNITKKLDTFLKVWEKSRLQEEQLKKVREKKNILKWKRTSFINKYDLNIVKLWNYSLDFQYLDSKYKKFVINYLKLFFLLDLLNWEILIENKSIDQIYEFWTLIKIRDMFYDLLEWKGKRDIFKLKKVKDNLIFEIWDKPVVINWKDWDCKIIYKFQKEVSSIWNNSWKKKINDIRIISSNCKPDIFVELHNKKENKDKYIIFDAKYSTDEIWNIYKKRFENLYKYKSWIVKCNDLQWDNEIKEWIWDMKPIIDKVLAIYPWVSEEKLAKLYKKSIDEIDFWWLVLRKWEDKDVKEFINNLL
jgi:hypothetical protein